MEGNKLFWKLSAFSKFDFKRFATDAERVKVRKPKPVPTSKASHSPQVEKAIPGSGIEVISPEVTDVKKRKKKKKKKSAAQLAELREEEIRCLRNKHHIHVEGTDIANPLQSFDQLLSEREMNSVILKNIQAEGYLEPTAIQRQAVPVMLENRDIMACAPTGSGKTAAFIIPILHHLKAPGQEGCRALVLAPTRELAKQILREFRKLSRGLGLRSCFIESESKAEKKSKEVFDILVTTPNRLVYMLEQDPPLLAVNNVEWLIVDESDKLFEAGKRGFRDQLGTIYRACSSSKLHRAMFSATFAQDVQDWCRLNLDNVVQVTIGARNTAINTVEQRLVFTGDEDGKLIELRNLIREGMSPPVLVFVQSKERAKHLHLELKYDNINIDVIHADRPQAQRDAVIKNFRLGHTWVLICTELMGRGIDFKGVNLVINYDFPATAISYIHRIGRTGRAGHKGKAVTFFTENDKPNLQSIAKKIRQAGCPVPAYMTNMKRSKRKKRSDGHVPERKGILQMDPRDFDKLQRKRKYSRQTGSRKKAKIEK